MEDSCRVTVAEGILQGETKCTRSDKEYLRFLGIPYAKPPIGKLRFRNPEPIEKWEGIRDATKEGNPAPQIKDISTEFIGDEDCLYLNIATPMIPTESTKLCPVFIYIHGGAFINGSGSFDQCGPEYIIEKDCLFVSINYRLNVMGFLCLETEESPGNMGLEDQHMALKWIHNNISKFGGDPNNITLIGISAGAAGVESHILSPKTPPNLFHKAIIQSGTLANLWTIDRDYLDLAKRLAKRLGKNTENPKDLIDLFMNSSVKDLVTEAAKLLTLDDSKKLLSFGCFKPVIWSGNKFMNKLPIEILRSGKFLKVPVIYGYCAEEFLLLEGLFKNMEEYQEHNFGSLIPKQLQVDRNEYGAKLKKIYIVDGNNSRTGHRVEDFITDIAFLSGIFATIDIKLQFNVQLYFYRFSYDGNMNYSKCRRNIKKEGTCHADDQTYIGTNCDVTEDLADATDIAVRKRIVRMWTDFAKHVNPTPRLCEEITTEWLPMEKDEFIYMEINQDLVLNRGLDEYTKRRRELWIEMYSHYQ